MPTCRKRKADSSAEEDTDDDVDDGVLLLNLKDKKETRVRAQDGKGYIALGGNDDGFQLDEDDDDSNDENYNSEGMMTPPNKNVRPPKYISMRKKPSNLNSKRS